MAKEQLVPHDFFTALPFWADLNRQEQATVETETKSLSTAMAAQIVSRLQIGEHLVNLQAVLEGKRLFRRYLGMLHFSWRTGYRYMEAYRAVRDKLPAAALKLAAARGIDLVGYTATEPFGQYTEPIKQLPPPADVAKVPQWLDQIEEKRKALPKSAVSHKVSRSADTRLKLAFRSAVGHGRHVAAGKARTVWGLRLCAMILGELAIPGQRVEPESPPEGFRAVVGRPKLPK